MARHPEIEESGHQLSSEQVSALCAGLKRCVPKDWLGMIVLDRYIADFKVVAAKLDPLDVNYYIDKYCEHAGWCADAIYETKKSLQYEENKERKIFFALDRETLELGYRNYLRDGFYSEVIELTVLMAFLGHEYEAFKFERGKRNLSVGLLGMFANTRRRQGVEKVAKLMDCLNSIYQAILTPEISIPHLRKLIDKAMAEGCYINPNVPRILDRAEEQGLKAFKRH